MKNILLLGDSIKECYQYYVEDSLKDTAKVYYTRDNGRFSTYMLRYIHDWFRAISDGGKIEFDIIHFNCGLWDVLRLSTEDIPLVSIDEYKANLRRIINRIKYYSPRARLIFATTTRVIEPGFEQDDEYGHRLNADIEEYNKAACDIMNSYGIYINDLWNVSREAPNHVFSDFVHINTEDGNRILGEAVLEGLKEYL